MINYDMVLLLCSCVYLNKMGYMEVDSRLEADSTVPRWVVKNLLVWSVGEQMVLHTVRKRVRMAALLHRMRLRRCHHGKNRRRGATPWFEREAIRRSLDLCEEEGIELA